MDFKDVLAFLNSLNSISYGGCGIAAISVLRWCKKDPETRGSIEVSFVYIEDERLRYEANNTFLKEKRLDELRVPYHVAFSRDNVLRDADGVLNPKFYPLEQDDISEEVLLILLNHGKWWNSDFDRGKQIPLIESTLDIDLSDIRR